MEKYINDYKLSLKDKTIKCNRLLVLSSVIVAISVILLMQGVVSDGISVGFSVIGLSIGGLLLVICIIANSTNKKILDYLNYGSFYNATIIVVDEAITEVYDGKVLVEFTNSLGKSVQMYLSKPFSPKDFIVGQDIIIAVWNNNCIVIKQ